MSKIKQFLTELNALQEEFGLYVVSDTEEELLISLERNNNPNNIVCYVGDHTINGFDDIKASFINEEDIYDIESFAYDKNGNRTRLAQNGDVYTYEYGKRNRLEKIYVKKKLKLLKKLFAEYSYDTNGNTTNRKIYEDDGVIVKSEIAFEYALAYQPRYADVAEQQADDLGNGADKIEQKSHAEMAESVFADFAEMEEQGNGPAQCECQDHGKQGYICGI